MGVFLRVFDPKGYQHNYTKSDWRNVGRERINPVDDVRPHHIRDELHTENARQLPAETQARVQAPHPGEEEDEQKTEPDPYKTSIKKAREQTSLEKEYTDKREFYGPGDLTAIASDLMITDCPTISFQFSVEEAAKLFSPAEMRSLPVVTEKNIICGLISREELFKDLINGDITKEELSEIHVNQLMTSPVLCCLPGTPIEVIMKAFIEEKIGILPVVDSNDRLMGMITKTNVLQYIFKSPHFFDGRD